MGAGVGLGDPRLVGVGPDLPDPLADLRVRRPANRHAACTFVDPRARALVDPSPAPSPGDTGYRHAVHIRTIIRDRPAVIRRAGRRRPADPGRQRPAARPAPVPIVAAAMTLVAAAWPAARCSVAATRWAARAPSSRARRSERRTPRSARSGTPTTRSRERYAGGDGRPRDDRPGRHPRDDRVARRSVLVVPDLGRVPLQPAGHRRRSSRASAPRSRPGRADGTQGCATLGPTCRLVIVAPIGGSPAEKAGLRPGDLVLATDGVHARRPDRSTTARERIRGPKDTVVELHDPARRRRRRSPLEDHPRHHPASARSSRGSWSTAPVGYVRLTGFSDRRAEELDDGRPRPRRRPAGRSSSSTCAATRAATSRPRGRREPVHRLGPDLLGAGRQGQPDGEPTPIPGGAATDPTIRARLLIDRGTRVGERDRRRRAPGQRPGDARRRSGPSARAPSSSGRSCRARAARSG